MARERRGEVGFLASRCARAFAARGSSPVGVGRRCCGLRGEGEPADRFPLLVSRRRQLPAPRAPPSPAYCRLPPATYAYSHVAPANALLHSVVGRLLCLRLNLSRPPPGKLRLRRLPRHCPGSSASAAHHPFRLHLAASHSASAARQPPALPPPPSAARSASAARGAPPPLSVACCLALARA
ncbi:hypothetical protein DAI22_12g173400 [Oryza sativa Japonica Group]|nr:hypothetical protein DAI22_12g173400 [Oryza sativa Japonica Group]